MDLDRPLSVDVLESMLLETDWSKPQKMTLPLSFAGVQPFCTEAALLQLIVTVARRSQGQFSVCLNGFDTSQAGSDQSLEKALGNPYVVLAWVMANTIVDENNVEIDQQRASVFGKYLDAMESYDFMSTHESVESRANLICVQRARREYIRALYTKENGAPILRSHAEIRLMVQDILAQIVPAWTGRKLREIATPLARLSRELIENAEWWARTDVTGTPYSRGVRAITFRLVDIDDQNCKIFCGSNPFLNSYLQSMLLAPKSNWTNDTSSLVTKRNFIELTVVDSGPGLVRRWLATREGEQRYMGPLENLSLDEEREAIAACFQKWRTSSHDPSRGIGLFSVARLLRERNGFMRIRTGRLSYFFGTESAIRNVQLNSFLKKEENSYQCLDDGTHVFFDDDKVAFFLKPWTEEIMAAVEGTTYSILLPVQEA